MNEAIAELEAKKVDLSHYQHPGFNTEFERKHNADIDGQIAELSQYGN